ncbi:carbohydrate kinase family protein [Aliihoeflea sp. PC F10.4]
MILCCGDALIDMIPSDLTGGKTGFVPHVGGAVFNTTVALGRLEMRPSFFHALSSDLFGDMLAGELEKSNVDFSLAPRVNRPTTLAFVVLTDGHARYVFYDEASAGRMLREEDLPALPARIEALFFGGISLVAEPSGSAFEALMMRERASRFVMIDPNIRPAFIRDETAYRARLSRMMGAADIVKLSEEDLEWLAPGRVDDAVGELVAQGVHAVLVTRGENGATAVTAKGSVSVKPPRAKVVDTVGAGDAFNAGFIEGLAGLGLLSKAAIRRARPNELERCLVRAVEVAAVTVGRQGANPPHLAELSPPSWRAA